MPSKVLSKLPYLSWWRKNLSDIWYILDWSLVVELNEIFVILVQQGLKYGVPDRIFGR